MRGEDTKQAGFSLVQPALLGSSARTLNLAVAEAEKELKSFCGSVTIVRDRSFEAPSRKYRA